MECITVKPVMENLSQRILNLSTSQTLAMAQKSRELKAKGIDIISMSLGEPDFNTPAHIKEAAKKAIDENYSFYTPVSGYDELRKAISDKFKRENNLDYAIDQIVVSCGAKHSIANVMMCLLDKDDEVVVPIPYWVSYVDIIKIAEGKSVFVNSTIDTNFKVTPEQVEKAITSKTKAFIFSSPSNPSGSLYTKDELKAFADMFAKYPNVYIISDEIYEHINFIGKHESIAQFENIRDRVITINGVSKGYAMTGWRIGYIGAPKWIAKACEKLQGQFTSGASSIAQRAAIAALNSGNDFIKEMNVSFKRRRDLIIDLIKEIPGIKYNIPEGAFYILPNVTGFFGKSDGVTKVNNADDLSMYLLNNAHVATVSGSAFGIPNCIRLSYATSDDNIMQAMIRIKAALSKLK